MSSRGSSIAAGFNRARQMKLEEDPLVKKYRSAPRARLAKSLGLMNPDKLAVMGGGTEVLG